MLHSADSDLVVLSRGKACLRRVSVVLGASGSLSAGG